MISTSKILVPHDGSEMSDKALDKAIEFCKSFKSELILLYVVDDRLISSDAILGFIREKLTLENAKVQTLKILKMGAEAMLRERMKKASGYAVNVRFIIRMGSPAEGITDVAASEKVDLIIMGSREGAREKEFGVDKPKLLGSTAWKVLEIAESAVMVIK
ncbi:MAG TPA: universal stress protein [Candidatus Bathyarchaeia archaeon]|nr:universal stress protein [Candidatus Bathyarchaeia archaeon]